MEHKKIPLTGRHYVCGTLLDTLSLFKKFGYFRPEECNDAFYKKVLYHLRTVIFGFFQFGSLMTIEILAMICYWPNLTHVSGAAFIFMANITHAVKLTNLLINRNKFNDLLGYFIEALSKEDLQNKEVLEIIIRNEKRAFRDVIAIVGCTVIAVIGLMLNGDRMDPSGLPLVGKYPFDVSPLPIFATLYVHQMVAVLVAAYFNVTVDMFTTNMCIQFCCLFQLLKREICLINNIPADKQDEISLHLDKIAKRHCLLKFKCNSLGSTIGIAALGQFLGSTFIICISFYQFYKASDASIVAILATLVTSIWPLVQAYIYCYYGNEVMLESQSVANSFAELNWYNFDQLNKKKMLFIMHQSQRPELLLAGGLFKITLGAFSSLLRIAYSLFSVMVNKSETPK